MQNGCPRGRLCKYQHPWIAPREKRCFSCGVSDTVRKTRDCPHPNRAEHTTVDATGSGKATPTVHRATVVELSHTHQHAHEAPVALTAAGRPMPQNPPKVLLDSGAPRQVVRMDANASDGPLRPLRRAPAQKGHLRSHYDPRSFTTF